MTRSMRLVVRLASVLVVPDSRDRYREQWLAELEGADEAAVPSWRVAAGVLRSAPSVNAGRETPMPLAPIGPLAIILRRTNASRNTVLATTLVLLALLVIGVVTLTI